MRTLVMVLISIAATSAVADDAPAVVDLDKDPDAAEHLASAAGACRPKQPAVIRTWCRNKPLIRRFTTRVDTTATDAGAGKLRVSLPVREYGKGFVFGVVPPTQLDCTPTACVPPKTVNAVIQPKAKVVAADVRVVVVDFEVTSKWTHAQWWGPKPAKVAFALFDATGKLIGEGTLAPPKKR